MEKYKNKIIIGVIVVAILAFAFWWGGDAPSLRGWNTQESTDKNQALIEENIKERTKENITHEDDNSPVKIEKKIESPQNETKKEHSDFQRGENDEVDDTKKEQTEIILENNPAPVEIENAVVTNKELTCTLSVRCDTILNNMKWLNKEKTQLVPKDGVIFSEKTVTFYEGESVFNLLLREMKRNKIHMEFTNTPIYHSAYIEGIGNLYEFDCGELSGWMYKVNGWFPNYGCSQYLLKEGDKVEWLYTCDLGKDIGGRNSFEN